MIEQHLLKPKTQPMSNYFFTKSLLYEVEKDKDYTISKHYKMFLTNSI